MRTGFGLTIAMILAATTSLAAQTAELLGAYTWVERNDAFGGFSALEIEADGTRFVALSDRGRLLGGRLERSGDDQLISDIRTETDVPLTTTEGRAIPHHELDSEGLSVAGDGDLFISFEGVHGIGRFGRDGRMRSQGLDRHPDFTRMQPNSSLESLAIDARGRLYTAPERSGRLLRPFPVYRRDSGGWSQPFSIPRSEDYLLVGMDFGPDGRLYVLERALRGIFLSTRIRSFDVSDTALSGEELVLQTTTGTHENLEGISVWRDRRGDLRLSLISDDNFNPFLRTQIVEYRLR